MTQPTRLCCLLFSTTGRRVALVRHEGDPGEPATIDAPSGDLTEEEQGWAPNVMGREGSTVICEAAARVFEQLAGIAIAASKWQITAIVIGSAGTTIYCCVFDDVIDHVALTSEGRVQVYGVGSLQRGAPRLSWLIPMVRERDIHWPLAISVA